MGRLINGLRVPTALLARDTRASVKKIHERFATRREDDVGGLEVRDFKDAKECKAALDQERFLALCLDYNLLPPVELASFVNDIRVCHPLISVCLIGKQSELRELAGMPEGWKERFSHYYKIWEDQSERDFEENLGVVRDLLVADAIKVKGLGVNRTMPGNIIRIKHVQPVGYWVVALLTLAAALTSTILNTHLFW
jgi:hypothetical protein